MVDSGDGKEIDWSKMALESRKGIFYIFEPPLALST